MVFFNYALRKLNAKIVYYGPGLCGKTTNLQWIHDNFEGGDKGKMVSLATEGDRTIFFDLLPLDIGTIRGMDVTLQLYTVPGQVHYNSTRQLVLRGADGVVFVADSQRAMHGSNSESLENLEENLALQGVTLSEFPHVLQFNKRDLGDVMQVEEMDSMLNRYGSPFFEAVAVEGIGVQDTLEGIVRLVMRSLKDRYENRGPGVKPVQAGAVRPVLVPAGPPSGGPASASVIRPLGGTSPESGPAETPAPPSFEIEKEPEPVSFGDPDSGELEGFEPGGGVPDFDDPGPAFAPPEPAEGEAVDSGSGEFEDADTQTGILVPAIDEESEGGDERLSPDRLPEGPGDLFEGDDEHTSVARYDTADIEECEELEPVDDEPDSGEQEEIDVLGEEPPIAAGGGQEEPRTPVDESGESDGYDENETTAAVDDLVASVLGTAADRGGDLRVVSAGIPEVADETSESAGAPEEIPEVSVEPESEVFPSGDDVPETTDNQFLADVEDPDDGFTGPPEETAEVADEDVRAPNHPAVGPPVVFDDTDPFDQPAREEEPIQDIVRPSSVELVPRRDETPVTVTAGDNSLALKLTGTGAIVESGQVRALDIEVPVPGNWVGNRKVTLQLRLTLSPVTEDEDDGTTGPA